MNRHGQLSAKHSKTASQGLVEAQKGGNMAVTITVANRKGGAGKTTTAHAIGSGLHHKGNRVLFVDLDSQMNLTFVTGAEIGTASAMDVCNGSAKAAEAIVKTETGDLIPATTDLALADKELSDPQQLKKALDPIRQQYDYIVIDCPAQLGILTTMAMTASDWLIITTNADRLSLQGIGLLNETIQTVKTYCNPDLKIAGVVLTRYDGRSNLSKDMKVNAGKVAEALQSKLFQTVIRECTAVKEAADYQTDIYTYSPRSNAAKDYAILLSEILSEITEGR